MIAVQGTVPRAIASATAAPGPRLARRASRSSPRATATATRATPANGTPVARQCAPAPLAGRVSMDMLTVDVTDLPPVADRRPGRAVGRRRARRDRGRGGRHDPLRTRLPRRSARARRSALARVKILVTGSSGRIGGAIAARLSLRHQVTGLDLRPGAADVGASATSAIRALLAAACAGIDAVIHTASLHVPDLRHPRRAGIPRGQCRGHAEAAGSGGEAGIRRFVYTSTTSLYGDALLPEAGAGRVGHRRTARPRPRDIYDETKLAAEAGLRARPRARGMTCISLRMSRCFPEHPRLRRDLPAVPRRRCRGRRAGA